MLTRFSDHQIKRFTDIEKDSSGAFLFRIVMFGPGPRGLEIPFGDRVYPSMPAMLTESQIDDAAKIRLRRQYQDELFKNAVKEGMTQ